MKMVNTEEYEKEKEKMQRLTALVRRMAGLMLDYDLHKVDYQAVDLMKEAEEVALN